MNITVNKIASFKGDNYFLSNMYYLESPFVIGESKLWTVEHYYQYHKSDDPKWHQYVIKEKNPYKVRKASRNPNICKLKEGWDSIKDSVMEEAICFKFSNHNSNILEFLLATDNSILVEGNYYNDDYWGWCLKKKAGKNKLGKLIMARRDYYLKDNCDD